MAIIAAVGQGRAVRDGVPAGLEELLARQSGVLAGAQALPFLSRAALQHRVDSGRWLRPRRGVYVARPALAGHRQRCWLAVLAAPAGTLTEIYSH